MLKELLVRHCAPTLAGLKTANMFSCRYADAAALRDNIDRLNRLFSGKGLRVLLLRCREGRALIYVYRPARLARDLRQDTAEELLTARGYLAKTPSRCLLHLIERLSRSDDFPHEIGLFLGYPPEDVCGFIRDAAGCKFAGLWKVYGDEDAARRTFDRFNKCTRLYCAQLRRGTPLERLAVADR